MSSRYTKVDYIVNMVPAKFGHPGFHVYLTRAGEFKTFKVTQYDIALRLLARTPIRYYVVLA